MKPQTLTLNGKRWQFCREPIRRRLANGKQILGECSPADETPRYILIEESLCDQQELEVILHELLHASAWDVLDETFVESTGIGISRFLWRLGYRKLTPDQIQALEAE